MRVITWWVQLIKSTAIEHHEALAEELRIWCGELAADPRNISSLVWEKSNPMPVSFWAQGAHMPPDWHDLLDELIRPWMSQDEYLLFAVTLDAGSLDSTGIYYYVVTQDSVGRVSGEAIAAQLLDVAFKPEG